MLPTVVNPASCLLCCHGEGVALWGSFESFLEDPIRATTSGAVERCDGRVGRVIWDRGRRVQNEVSASASRARWAVGGLEMNWGVEIRENQWPCLWPSKKERELALASSGAVEPGGRRGKT